MASDQSHLMFHRAPQFMLYQEITEQGDETSHFVEACSVEKPLAQVSPMGDLTTVCVIVLSLFHRVDVRSATLFPPGAVW